MKKWHRKDDAIVDESNGLLPIDFVEALKNQSEEAWAALKYIAFAPVLKERKMKDIMHEKHLEEDEVFGMFVERLMVKRKIELIKEPQKIIPFVQESVRNLLKATISAKAKAKDAKTLYIEDRFSNSTNDEIASDVSAVDKIPEDEDKVSERELRLNDDERAIIRRCFEEFWKKKPRQAIVLNFRNEGLSDSEISMLMGENTVNNVTQLAKRGGRDLAKHIQAKDIAMPGVVATKGRLAVKGKSHA